MFLAFPSIITNGSVKEQIVGREDTALFFMCVFVRAMKMLLDCATRKIAREIEPTGRVGRGNRAVRSARRPNLY